MKIPNWVLFAASSLIWGTTWYAIKFQVKEVAPAVSIAFRFAIAASILFLYLSITRKKLRYSLVEHFWFALQGIVLFGICYWLTYWAETELTSGLVAVLSSLIIFFNIIFGRILLKRPINPKTLIGFFLGITGMALLYKDEISLSKTIENVSFLLFIAILANVVASLGNIISVRNQGAGLPIQQTNAFGMGYSAFFMFSFALVKGDEVRIPLKIEYLSSLIYLSIFGSIIAFYCYLTLLGRLGPAKAAYTNLVIPIIALVVSTIFESFQWTLAAFVGLALVLLGNYVALFRKSI